MLGYLPGGGSVGWGPAAPASGNGGARRQEAAGSFSQQQGENFAVMFLGLVSLGSVFAWVTAAIAFLMLRSCIHLLILLDAA